MLGVVGVVGGLALGVYAFSKPNKRSERKLISASNAEYLTTEDLLAILQNESEARGKRRRAVNRVVFGYLGIAFVLLSAIIIVSALTGEWMLLDNLLSAILSFASIFSLFAFYAANKNEKRAALQAAQYDDVRFVGPFLEAMHFQDTKLKNSVTERLTTLLPRIKASDSDLLNADQRFCLYKSLFANVKPKPNKPYLLAALGAIAQIGDDKALPFVEPFYLEGMIAVTGQEVFEAAYECRTTLKERAEADRKNNLLLRPAATSCDPEVLLKPVGAPQEADAVQLLRASTRD